MVKLPKYPNPWKDFKEVTGDACWLNLPSAVQMRRASDKLIEIATAMEKFESGLIAEVRVLFNAETDSPIRLATPAERDRYYREFEDADQTEAGRKLIESRDGKFIVDPTFYNFPRPVYMKAIKVEMTPAEYELVHGKPFFDKKAATV